MFPCAAVLLASLIGNPSKPAVSPGARPEELVRLLGDESFRVREAAALELIRRGSSAVAALTAGLRDADPEISERSRQLLPQAASVERNEKLARLVKDPSAPPPRGLAGLDRFLKATGDSKEARQLYADMMALHHRTIEAAETDPKAAAEQFTQFGNDAYNRWQIAARTGRYSYDNMFSSPAEIAFFLFLSGDPRLRNHPPAAPDYSSILFNGIQISKAISEKEGSVVMRKLFLDWLENESQAHMQQRGFQLAAQAGLQEALPIALRLLEKKDQQNYAKAQVMIALIKLGGKEHVRILDKFLDDKQVIGSVNFGNGPKLTVQLRDVAMGVQIQLAGQKLSDYGFDNRFGGGGTSYIYYGFPDDDDKSRTEGHAKWKEWSKKHLKKPADAGKPADQKPEPVRKK